MSLFYTVAPGDLLWSAALYDGIQAAKAGTLDLSAAYQQFAYLILPEVTVPGAHGDVVAYGAFKIDNSGNITWPGGTQDPGEVPTNHIIQIYLNEIVNGVATTNPLIRWDPVDISFRSLFTATSLVQMERRMFAGDDYIRSHQTVHDATDDVLHGWGGNDWIDATNSGGRDAYYGDDGDDLISVYDGTASVPLAGDRTILYGGNGNDTLEGDEGTERMFGGAGNDAIGQFGFGGDDSLYGGSGRDTLISGDGDNLLEGGAGDDVLRAGTGVDTITGGLGADTFVFLYREAQAIYDSSVALARRDQVTDFNVGQDHLRIVNSVSPPVPVQLIGAAAFTGIDQVRWIVSGGNTTVFVNTDADLQPEMAITLVGVTGLQASDFI